MWCVVYGRDDRFDKTSRFGGFRVSHRALFNGQSPTAN
jgi:hypothetical protein